MKEYKSLGMQHKLSFIDLLYKFYEKLVARGTLPFNPELSHRLSASQLSKEGLNEISDICQTDSSLQLKNSVCRNVVIIIISGESMVKAGLWLTQLAFHNSQHLDSMMCPHYHFSLLSRSSYEIEFILTHATCHHKFLNSINSRSYLLLLVQK